LREIYGVVNRMDSGYPIGMPAVSAQVRISACGRLKSEIRNAVNAVTNQVNSGAGIFVGKGHLSPG
jgi:hypothetical protein